MEWEGGRGAAWLPAGEGGFRFWLYLKSMLVVSVWEMHCASSSGQIQPAPGPPHSHLCYCVLPIPHRAAAALGLCHPHRWVR